MIDFRWGNYINYIESNDYKLLYISQLPLTNNFHHLSILIKEHHY